jgi:hypothetical protein
MQRIEAIVRLIGHVGTAKRAKSDGNSSRYGDPRSARFFVQARVAGSITRQTTIVARTLEFELTARLEKH